MKNLEMVFDCRRIIAKWSLSFGISFGSNTYTKKKPYIGNFFVEVDFLIWTLGIEIRKKSEKQKTKT